MVFIRRYLPTWTSSGFEVDERFLGVLELADEELWPSGTCTKNKTFLGKIFYNRQMSTDQGFCQRFAMQWHIKDKIYRPVAHHTGVGPIKTRNEML